MEYEKLKEMPKLELHCHLDGSLSQDFVQQMSERPVALSELQVKEECRDLAEYLEKFDIPMQCIQTEEGLKGAGYDLIRSVSKEQIKYIEVRFAPLFSVNEQLNVEQVISAVLAGLEKGKQEYGVSANIITCAMRHHSEEENLKMLKAARLFLGEGVCAADLAGNEAAYPMTNYMELFTAVKRLEMPFTIHAGECGNARNIADAIEVGAKRIGHGIAMRGNAEIQKLCLDNRIGIEMCPISNLQTKAVPSTAEYPLREFLDAGLLVTINTDNRMVSNTSVRKELDFIQSQYQIQDEEIYKMMKNAVEISFADDSIKHMLYQFY